MATVTETGGDALHILQAWFSPGYPVGSFAYSHGLEAEIASGRVTDAAALEAWIAAVLLHGAAQADAVLLAAAARGGDADALSARALALASSSERAMETTAMGAAFAKATSDVWGTESRARPYPVAVGVAAHALDLPPGDVLRHFLHAVAANLISVAVRFMPLGQTAGLSCLRNLLAVIDTAAARARDTAPEDIATAVPGADLAAMEHETMPVRIFRS